MRPRLRGVAILFGVNPTSVKKFGWDAARGLRNAALPIRDHGFCRIWEAIGGEIFVDANSNL
jgi:hypothetical protein